MISLKRNSKGNLMPASGKRVRAYSIYQPGQETDFEISRTAFSDFLKCPRDFYLKRCDDGSISNYPIRWTEICGEVFHPLCLKYSKKILKNLPTPDFSLPYL